MPETQEPEDDNVADGRVRCRHPRCTGAVEAGARIWFDLDADGTWTVGGVCDDGATIHCDAHEHDNSTPELHRSLSAYIESILPGTTWAGSDPRRHTTA